MVIIWSIVGFIVSMGILVTIHEWGHYFVARLFNIKVTHFSIGFGAPIYQKQKGDTCYQIGKIPLGGYVKFADEREGPVAAEDLKRAFNRQSVYKKALVVLAGPVVNLVFAWWVFSAIYLLGVPGVKPIFNVADSGSELAKSLPATIPSWTLVSIEGNATATWKDVHQAVLKGLISDKQSLQITVLNNLDHQSQTTHISLKDLDINQPKQPWLNLLGFAPVYPSFEPIIDTVMKGSPADKLGLESGDYILSINNQKIQNWKMLVELVQINPLKPVVVEYERNHKVHSGMVYLEQQKLAGGQVIGRLGASVKVDENALKESEVVVQYGVYDAFIHGFNHSMELIGMTLDMIKGILFGHVSAANLSGPVSIAEFSGQAMQNGLISFLSLLGLLSLSLGILNLLPLPVLDGGHLLFYVIEMIKGVPVRESIEIAAQKVGLVLILGLTFLALLNDVVRISNG